MRQQLPTKKEKARISILSRMLSFPTISGKDWSSDLGGSKAEIGDLVSLSSAPDSKWYLSWLCEIDPNNGWTKYLLESVEDGSLCWWENVGLNIYSRERVANNPSWRWSDDQFAFNERWLRICYKKNGAYIVLPLQASFLPDGGLVLDVRIRWGTSDYHNPRTFPNWKKVTLKTMDTYFKECIAGYEATKPKPA